MQRVWWYEWFGVMQCWMLGGGYGKDKQEEGILGVRMVWAMWRGSIVSIPEQRKIVCGFDCTQSFSPTQ